MGGRPMTTVYEVNLADLVRRLNTIQMYNGGYIKVDFLVAGSDTIYKVSGTIMSQNDLEEKTLTINLKEVK
jgi:hypothetical protein